MTYKESSIQPDKDHAVMRCIVDGKGLIVFMTPALGWAIGQKKLTPKNAPVEDILHIVQPGGEVSNKPVINYEPGFYEVILDRHDRDPLLLKTRLDHVTNSDGQKHTVLWLDPDLDSLKRKEEKNFHEVAKDLSDTVVRLKEEKQTPKKPLCKELGEISKDDGELRHFINLSNELFGVYRQDGSFVRVNYAFNRALGYTDDDLRHIPFIELIHEDDRERADKYMQEVTAAPTEVEMQVDFETRATCKDGSIRHIEWLQKSVKDHVYIIGHDITSVREHEAELSRREQQLAEAQEIGKMGHWSWKVKEEEIDWSDQIYKIFGVKKNKFMPTLENISSMLFKRDVGKMYKSFQQAIGDKKDYILEFRLRHPSGDIRYIRCEGRCQIDTETKEVTALFGIMQDITERTLHEQALREAKEAAESAYSSKARFLANMSHELRTPLNAVIGFSDMMQRQLLGPIGNERYLDYISGIRESGEHLLDLINDILDMSKIEVGKYELEIENLNIAKVLRLALHMMEGRAHEAEVRLVGDGIPETLRVHVDRRALMQILLNLLSNAIKFTDAGGTVSLGCYQDVAGLAITVSDTGIGIPKDDIETVLLPFEQVDCELTRSKEGTGLGLAITKDLVELHNGRIEIDSEFGVGTTVSVLLPEESIAYPVDEAQGKMDI